MKTLVVIQARTGSTRLPGKVLLPLGGLTLLERMVERVRAARTRFDYVVATTTDPADDALAALCEARSLPVFRGHPTDLLDRHLMAARRAGATRVAKIPSDCPLIDPAAIDDVLSAMQPGDDYVSNLHPQSWPDGNDVEAMPVSSLALAHREARQPHEREHTTPFLWDQPGRFRLRNVRWDTGLDLSRTHRLTIDYAEDYQLITAVFDALYRPGAAPFGTLEIVDLLRRRPDLLALNARYAGVNWYRHHLAELRTVTAADTRNPEIAR